MKKNKHTKALTVWTYVFAGLLVFLVTVSIVLTQVDFLYYTICSAAGGSKRVLKKGNPDDYVYYESSYKSKNEALSAANALNERIVEEGIVLLKNEDNALPLKSERKITVFGKNSVNLIIGGSGSNSGSSADVKVDLADALISSGFTVNPKLREYYKSSQSGAGRAATPTMGDVLTGFPTGEASLPYPDTVKSSYAEYNDAAIVVISRICGEGYDLPRTMFKKGNSYTDWTGTDKVDGARNKDDHYLELDANETAMIKEACDNFDKVIVVVNSASPIEFGFLTDPAHYAYNAKIKAALLLGDPGAKGVTALGKILKGDVSPSGRTVDILPKDFTLDPTWFNFGNNLQADGNRYYFNDKARNAWFVEYREGIYTGYRYYETKGYEAGGDWYDKNVCYPFGYGLSYTEFSKTITPMTPSGATLTKDGKLSFEVTVTNNGSYDGKEVVQLWYSAPYTAGGIEKSHIVLGDFAKTEVISKSGGTKKVKVELDVRAMASYDYSDANGNGFKGYELDGGTYTFYIGNSSHCYADSEVAKFTYEVPAGGFKYEKDSVTDTTITNLFDDVSSGVKEYLSRKNNFENFNVLKGASEKNYRSVTQEFINTWGVKSSSNESDPWYSSSMPEQSKTSLSSERTDVKLWQLIGKDYDDELWDKLLNQLTVSEMVSLISTGNFRTLAIESIDKPLTIDADGPMGFALFMGDSAVYDTCYYASESVLAATWNRDLALEMGKMIGEEGLIGNEKGDGRPYSGWYAPAMNLHRSQFGGRNFEYYSEDGLLSGVMASNVVKGARSKGVYTYLKHFALNEQETKRDDNGLLTWANEQAMRENYFLPFEMSVKDGGATAVMSSFNRIGSVWTGGSYALLTSLLREEWGFNGMVITDFNLKKYMDTDQMIRAGGDLNLSAGKSPQQTTSSTDVTCIRRAAKNILYTVANSCAMNGYGKGIVYAYTTPSWVIALLAVDAVIFAVTAALASYVIIYAIKSKKGEITEAKPQE